MNWRPCLRPLAAVCETPGGRVWDPWRPCLRPLAAVCETPDGRVWDPWRPCLRPLAAVFETPDGRVWDPWRPCLRPLVAVCETPGGRVWDPWRPCLRPLGSTIPQRSQKAGFRRCATNLDIPHNCHMGFSGWPILLHTWLYSSIYILCTCASFWSNIFFHFSWKLLFPIYTFPSP
jgi:hypothetical protein